jgi:tyrosyl-tRNA synthetase
MGKTEKGALFLDPAMVSPYEFFQYWRNVQDADLRRFLLMFTFLPVEECEALCGPGKNPNEGKERLAWELTALIHGKDEADRALAGARAAFGGAGGDSSAMPQVTLPRAAFEPGYNVVDLFTAAGLAPSKSEARRLVQQGGAFVSLGGGDAAGRDLRPLTDAAALLTADDLDPQGRLILRAGKKRYCLVTTR